jgi:uncharacterized HAD superfamily protein
MDIKCNLYKLPKDIDLVVGIPRSGIIPAYMMALALNIRACSLDELLYGVTGSYGQTRFTPYAESIRRIIIVDDSVSSGTAMRKARDMVAGLHLEAEIFFVTVYAKPGSEKLVDIALCALPMPRLFQWNYLNHEYLKFACLDIDGVLCIDPSEEENDDGERYIDFILNARPLHIPQCKVLALVTSRLEKYRVQTEQWLKDHNVHYEKLFMLDLPSKEDRLKQDGVHASFKAQIYNSLKNSVLFLESNKEQALAIAQLTKKAVFCVETDELLSNPVNFSRRMVSGRQRLKTCVWKIICILISSESARFKIKNMYKKIMR